MAAHASSTEVIRINDKLKTVIRKIDDERCEYVDRNITDASVAAQLDVKQASVARIRKENYGNLQKPHLPGSGLRTRVEVIEGQLVEAQRQNLELREHVDGKQEVQQKIIEAFAHAHNTLCTSLALNRIADVKNLAIDLAAISKQANGQLPYRR